jgi:eukaryotic-like serine/threonine-protein kinase
VGEKPPLAGELAPNALSPELDAVIIHSLAKRREDRYQDATSFRTDLQSARMGRSVSAAAWTDLERYRAELGSPLTARNGGTAVAGAVGAAAGAAAARARAAGADDAGETEVYSAVTGRGGERTEVVPTAAMAAQGRPVAYRQEPDTSAMAPVPNREEERSRGLGWLWGALAALAVVAIMWFAITNLLGTDGEDEPALVTVPSVVDRTIEQATTQLVGLDLRVDRVDTADDAPAGTVLDQDPEGGAEVEVGSTVRLTVSTGPGLVSVPTLTGMTESQARAALVNARLTVGEITRVDNSTESAGTVVGQSPSAGSTVEPGSVVSLQLSSGRMSVPNVIGLRQSEAQNALADRNLAYEVTFRESSEFEQGTVLDQDPRTGLVDQGTTVNLVVAQAPTPTPTPSPSPEPTTPTEEPTEEPTPTETEDD